MKRKQLNGTIKEEEENSAIIKTEDENTVMEAEEETSQKMKRIKREDVDENEQSTPNHCPYLITINKQVLDFDFEKICSVSLSHVNIYCCLVCGKYFQGRSEGTPAHTHSLEQHHYIFLNTNSKIAYCLPDNYAISEKSKLLEEIIYNLDPRYTEEQIQQLNLPTKQSPSIAINGQSFWPGYMGLNNLKYTDGMNCIIQALVHVTPLRNFLLRIEQIHQQFPHLQSKSSSLILHLSELTRKMYNRYNFKSHCSPHELLQCISKCSNKKFVMGQPCDPMEFLIWLLNYLQSELQQKKNIVLDTFGGKLELSSTVREAKTKHILKQSKKEISFVTLQLEPPPAPLFKNEFENTIPIPQVPIFQLLTKFDGKTVQVNPILNDATIEERIYKLQQLPQYIIFHIKRFSKNYFFKERNPTIINFPIKNLDMKDYFPSSSDSYKYDLIANIVQEANPTAATTTTLIDDSTNQNKIGYSKVQLWNRLTDKWIECRDLEIQEIQPQEVSVSESYILIYEKQSTAY